MIKMIITTMVMTLINIIITMTIIANINIYNSNMYFILHYYNRNLLVVLAHFAWVLPATYVLTKVNGFFGTKKKTPTILKKTKIENISEFSLDNEVGNNEISNDKDNEKSDLEKEIEKEIERELEIENEKMGKVNFSIESNKIINSDLHKNINMNINDSINENINTNNDDNINNENKNMNMNTNNIKIKKSVIRYGRKESPSFWKKKKIGTSDWLTFSPNENWVWWVIGGYTVSVLLFRITDWFNGNIIPEDWFEYGSGHIVSQMIAPEGNDVIALILGSIAPCLSAPLWEEIFYR
jgi:hypothetical protein